MKKLLTCIVSVLFAFCFCMTGCSTDDETTKQRVPLSVKRNIIEGTYGSSSSEGTYYGVGRTINAVTDEYITVSAGYAKIFDTDKLLDMNWNRSYAGQMRAKSSLGSSMKDLYAHLGVEFNLAIGGEASFLNIFSAGLQSDFEFAGNIAYSETANEIFYTFSQVYAATLIEIDEYYDLDKFREILSEEVLHDAASLQEGGMTASQFIYKYGTHAVLAGYYGGRVDCSYYLRNVGTQWDADAAVNYENSVSMAMSKLFNANVDSSFSVKGELSLDESTLQERFSSSSVGGKNFKAASITDFIENYGEWVSSVNKIEEHSNIVGLPNRSLVAIWDLFPHEYAQARQTLSSYFAEYAQATSSEFLSKYERHYSQDDGLIPGIHYISTKSLSCKLDNGYNYEQPSPKADDPHYSHEFELGKFVLKDCAEDLDQNDTYQLCDNIATNLTFRLEYDADTLPVQDNMKSRYVNSDEKQSGFYNLPWEVGERKVGKGMIVALVEYNDGSPSDKIIITNAFDGIKRGEEVVIANNIMKPCKISIAICYELVQWAPGFLGIVDDYWTNWRINQTFYIR